MVFPHTPGGVTETSAGNLAIVEYKGPHAGVYSTNLESLYPLAATGSKGFYDITSKEHHLFLSDWLASCIHVMRENGTYSHNISLTWQPGGIGIDVNNSLYVASYHHNAVYKIAMDGRYNRADNDAIFQQHPNVYRPSYVDVTPTKVAIGNVAWDTLLLVNINGTVEWNYGGTGTTDGKLDGPYDVSIDQFGRCIVADYFNKRIPLLSRNGSFIKNIASDMDGRPIGLEVIGNILYVSQTTPHRLLKFSIN